MPGRGCCSSTGITPAPAPTSTGPRRSGRGASRDRRIAAPGPRGPRCGETERARTLLASVVERGGAVEARRSPSTVSSTLRLATNPGGRCPRWLRRWSARKPRHGRDAGLPRGSWESRPRRFWSWPGLRAALAGIRHMGSQLTPGRRHGASAENRHVVSAALARGSGHAAAQALFARGHLHEALADWTRFLLAMPADARPTGARGNPTRAARGRERARPSVRRGRDPAGPEMKCPSATTSALARRTAVELRI